MTASQSWPFPGARWWKFDFHAHTPASLDTEWAVEAQRRKGPVTLTPEEWLLRYMTAEVDCVAITDHNTTEWIDRLKTAYERMRAAAAPGFRELHLFPGIEISVQGGFHLLVLFDPSSSGHVVANAFGAARYGGTPGDSDTTSRRGAAEIVRDMSESGGLAIPAHVDAGKGLLRTKPEDAKKPEVDREIILQLLDSRDIVAAEVVDPSRPRPAVAAGCTWTSVLGSDGHGKVGVTEPRTRFTWVKMAKPTIDGLRLALSDGAVSVRRSDEPGNFDPLATPEHVILGLEMTGGRVFGRPAPLAFSFSPWLNAIVGGRGTGKSSAVHALRLALARESELDHLGAEAEPTRTFRQFRQIPRNDTSTGALQPGTGFSVTVRRDGRTHRIDWRPGNKGDAIRDVQDQTGGGAWVPSTSSSVTAERFPIRIFSQGQIAGLAGEDASALLAIIDEAAGVAKLQAALAEATDKYLSLCASERELSNKLSAREPLGIETDDVARKIAGFEGRHHTEVLRQFDLRARQRGNVDERVAQARSSAEAVTRAAAAVVVAPLPEALFPTGDTANTALAAAGARLAAAVDAAKTDLLAIVRRLEEAASEAQRSLMSGDWANACEAAQAAYGTLVAQLVAAGVPDPRQYEKLVLERSRLRAEHARLDAVEAERLLRAQESATQLAVVREARRAITQRREEFLAGVLSQSNHVQITVRRRGQDERAVEAGVRALLGIPDAFVDDICPPEGKERSVAVVPALVDGLDDPDLNAEDELERRVDELASRLRAAQGGKVNFGVRFQERLLKQLAQRPEALDRLACWSPDDGLVVRYSETGDGKNMRAIGQASAGQRAAAMLAFLLVNGSEPLVLDQPEDDLDNLLIYDLIVKQLRDCKVRRQVIVVTHNPNIVVNGNAEMVHAFEFSKGQCRVGKTGSLQDPDVREEICRVMEGGREAFRRRYHRLGERPA